MKEEQRDLAKTIRVSGSILLSTVSNFLDFFKMEAGKQLDIVRAEVDIQVWTALHTAYLWAQGFRGACRAFCRIIVTPRLHLLAADRQDLGLSVIAPEPGPGMAVYCFAC